ncbi:hypothetical protein SAMN02745121_05447 [Nannocystis exedens]|uniref:Aspartyl protease n=1 Tax=Nannocystis exedens TaxID=54 RepID=A0A1I2D830_9BACT|nr:hypothetical protein [Nannocystis exedens]PCC70668.1 hypothetical protein NAEX_03732 [Nannocystis exedens]SFE76707.1 hypothetical protein SAMN02745121_05447 [Nannocystis exedens]
MDPRHGTTHPFTTRACGEFGRIAQPLVRVGLRRSASFPWSIPIEALVDTGATITLVSDKILATVPDFDRSLLGPELPWHTAVHGRETCRSVALDLRLGRALDDHSLVLEQALVYVTSSPLVAPILLGQRGVLDRVGLVHRNLGPKPPFRFLP